jgi:hypothetical protein
MTPEELAILRQIIEQNMQIADTNWMIVRAICGDAPEPDDEPVTIQ